MPSYRSITSVVHPRIRYGDAVYPPGGTFGPWIQPALELTILFDGEMMAWINGERRRAEPESVCLQLPGQEGRLAFAEDHETRCGWVHYPALNNDQGLLDRCARLPWSLPLTPGLRRLTRSLLDLAASRLPTRYELEELAGMQLLYQYIGEAERSSDKLSLPLERALTCIEDHLDATLDLEAIARVAATSKAQLIRIFRENLDTTPVAYLWTRRTERGVELLESTGLSVFQIASRCGFRTSHHFSRRIKETTGLSPSGIRERAWHSAKTVALA
jgi:AraC family transcriptional regulator of arabinose operon